MCSLLLPDHPNAFLFPQVKGGENSIPERLVITAIALKRGREGIGEGRGTWKTKNIRKKDRHLEIVRPVVPSYFFRFRGRMSTGGFFLISQALIISSTQSPMLLVSALIKAPITRPLYTQPISPYSLFRPPLRPQSHPTLPNFPLGGRQTPERPPCPVKKCFM